MEGYILNVKKWSLFKDTAFFFCQMLLNEHAFCFLCEHKTLLFANLSLNIENIFFFLPTHLSISPLTKSKTQQRANN